MDAAGIALTLAVLAANLAVKAKAFRTRMNDHRNLLDRLIDYFEMVRDEARMIAAEAQSGEEHPWQAIATRLEAMNKLLKDFNDELGELTQTSATTWLGKAIVQIRTDDAMPRIKQIQEQINENRMSLQSLLLCIALHRSTPSIPQPLPTPPPAPSYNIPTPPRKLSNASTLLGSPISDIENATRNLNISMIEQLLKDNRGLINTIDSVGRTLVDIAIYYGRSTDPSQEAVVDMLRRQGVKFTLTDVRHRKTYRNIVNAIKYQSGKT